MSLPDGLYDLLLTEALARRLPEGGALISEAKDGAVELLMDAVARQLTAILDDLEQEGTAKTERQLALINSLLRSVRERLAAEHRGSGHELIDLIAPPLRRLTAIKRDRRFPVAPEIGLAVPWLFTAGKGSPALLHEIRHELSSADTVDILVSFITVSGVRKLRDVLEQITARDASGHTATRIRVLTTTYTGVTEAKALDELALLPRCEVKVSLDGRRTRLHAKAWLFHRRTGFGSAYVGSANLSGAALTGGLEWTVKLTQRGQEVLFSRAAAHFETLWADSEFQTYDPLIAEHRNALRTALRQESSGPGRSTPLVSFFDLQPKSYQLSMLEQLANERAHGRTRNLVVSATGTGKTVVAAFDYRRTKEALGGYPKLLFVAHREEILAQALRTYREVLRKPDFGELLAGGEEPLHYDHVFATIDSASSRNLVAQFGAAHWHTVVIDECHRLAGDRFDALVMSVKPALLMGLTATPERSDGKSIAPYFDARPDGSPAVEMRLWHALDLQLLAPFEYYACDDPTDFSEVPWGIPQAERDAIDLKVTGNYQRAALVVNEWRRLAAVPEKSRAIVFCVTVAHAQFMARFLTDAGLLAMCVVGRTSDDERRKAPGRLADPNDPLCALVTVDLYNEGVDLPMVDTLILLRPTESPVLFQQQIGRGLRLAPGKESCLVLDFVGQHRVDFRFDRLLSSLTGLSRQALVDSVDKGFAVLPPGCHIQLQRQTRDRVLRSLRELVGQGWRRMKVELQSFAAVVGRANVTLGDFLREQRLELEDVYRASTGQIRSGWTTLKREAGLLMAEGGPEEEYYSRRFAALLHVDDPARIATLASLGAESTPNGNRREPSDLETLMVALQIDSRRSEDTGAASFKERLKRHPFARSELAELAAVLEARTSLLGRKVQGLDDLPLYLHAAYGIREILTAVGFLTADRQPAFQAGVLALPERRTELLFVTLDKADGFHAGIAYHDYAISTDRFHWQTQNRAGPDTAVGRRYLESPENGWQFQLFIRARKGDPYRACGPVTAVEITGDRPMTIIWQLLQPLPAHLFQQFSVLR